MIPPVPDAAVPRAGLVRHIPNALTVLRLIAIPFFIVLLEEADEGRSTAAAILFAAASTTDWFDGYLARRFQVQSRFGRIADPLADRVLITSAILLLAWHDRLPLLVVALLIGRDLVLFAGFKVAAERGYELSVVYLGKTATFVLMGALTCVMLTGADADWPLALVWVGTVLALAAGAVYVVTVGRMLRGRRAGDP